MLRVVFFSATSIVEKRQIDDENHMNVQFGSKKKKSKLCKKAFLFFFLGKKMISRLCNP